MDPITAAIVAALAAGALSGAQDAARDAVSNAYTKLKGLLSRAFGDDSDIAAAVEHLEARPDSAPRAAVVGEAVADTGAADRPDVLAAAAELMRLVGQSPNGRQIVQEVANSRNVAVAADHSTARVVIHGADELDGP